MLVEVPLAGVGDLAAVGGIERPTPLAGGVEIDEIVHVWSY